MIIELKPGKYVMAVSGGVDSVSLLQMLTKQPELKLIVAHFDHGIRPDSKQDRQFVQELARSYNLPFVYDEGHLGPAASEDMARKARYGFLRKVQSASGARAIITAHHQDDWLETAILNLARGTGRKGLSSLASKHDLIRPLLHLTKQNIIDHAKAQGLTWREDATNKDLNYSRNYVRYKLLKDLSDIDRQKLLQILAKAKLINDELDQLLINHLHLQSKSSRLDRQWFINLPHNVAKEVMATWLRAQGITNFDRNTLERLVIGAKTSWPGKKLDVAQGTTLSVGKYYLALKLKER